MRPLVVRPLAILSLFLTLALAACATGDGATTAAAPSIDCTKVASPVDPLLCEDPQLARLDSELASIFARAEADPDSVPSGNDLRSTQRQWIVQRNRCAADADPQGCLVRSYAARIQVLRMGSGDARSTEADGITEGPFVVRCEGLADPMVATFINAEPNLVYLSGSMGSLTLTQGMSGSGARYVDATESTVFWNKGDSALFTSPGAADTTCALERI